MQPHISHLQRVKASLEAAFKLQSLLHFLNLVLQPSQLEFYVGTIMVLMLRTVYTEIEPVLLFAELPSLQLPGWWENI